MSSQKTCVLHTLAGGLYGGVIFVVFILVCCVLAGSSGARPGSLTGAGGWGIPVRIGLRSGPAASRRAGEKDAWLHYRAVTFGSRGLMCPWSAFFPVFSVV